MPQVTATTTWAVAGPTPDAAVVTVPIPVQADGS